MRDNSRPFKYCSKCKLYYGPEYEHAKCSCGSFVSPLTCKTCGEDKDLDEYHDVKEAGRVTKRRSCKPCYNFKKTDSAAETVGLSHYRGRRRKVVGNAIEQLEHAIEHGKELKHLTEKEWLQTCNHFNGCALCGHEYIEVRLPWINPTIGGRYVKSNVIPVCESCNHQVTTYGKENMFEWATSTTVLREGAKRVVDYIGGLVYEEEI